MNLKRSIMSALSIVLLLLATNVLAEKMPSTMVGVYKKLPGAEYKFDGKTVEVVEYMSFYCHTCYNFESSIPIIKGNFPKRIKWKIVPIYWGDHGSPKPGEAYLIAEDMGKGEAMKKAIFDAQMVQKKNIADINILESLAKDIGLGPEFGKRLRSGEKTGEAREALDTAKKVGIEETPTIVIAGNIKTDPHAMDHNLDTFRVNILAIISSILNQQ